MKGAFVGKKELWPI